MIPNMAHMHCTGDLDKNSYTEMEMAALICKTLHITNIKADQIICASLCAHKI